MGMKIPPAPPRIPSCEGFNAHSTTADGSWDIAVNWSDEIGSFQLKDGGDFEQEADSHLLFHSVGGDVYGDRLR